MLSLNPFSRPLFGHVFQAKAGKPFVAVEKLSPMT
jgi:hypothetical protein